MFVYKNFNFKGVMSFTGGHLIWITAWASLVTLLFEFTNWNWMTIPWLPLSLVGIAVAFYVGFKNNQSYDRLWEARKIWGGIVNSSRSWGISVKAYVTNQFNDKSLTENDLQNIKKKLIYRHIAWLYALRSQLLISTPWEHINQNIHVARVTEKRRKTYGLGLIDDDYTMQSLNQFLEDKEYESVLSAKNTATQIIDRQSQHLAQLRGENIIDDFRHIDLQSTLKQFYDYQGMCERIKKFPFPRQYGAMSNIFVGIFIFLLPFGMIGQFADIASWGTWLSIPFTVLVAWVFLVMELVGDYSENPFEGLGNDIPMLSLCRTIEIDLKEMLGEADLPPTIEAKNGVLM
ncbi:MAG: bestrophin family ion channel [Vicingaceae bacterium]